jgi:hypothetical protein
VRKRCCSFPALVSTLLGMRICRNRAVTSGTTLRRSGAAHRERTSASTAALAALALTLSACTSGNGGVEAHSEDGRPNASFAATPFYAEFRTRPYFFITHTFITYGAQDSSGHPLEQKAVGFYPSRGGAFGPFLVGFTGEVGQEDYFVNLPASAAYRRSLTTDQYRRLLAFIDKERANARTYNLLFYNCNDFVADAAEAIGLKAPLLRAIPPVLFILLLKEMNN